VTSPSPDAAGVRGGLRLGRVLGVPVFVAPSWFLFAAFVVLGYGPQLAGELGPGRAYTAAGSFAVLLLVSVLLHELGHCVVARAFGLPVRSITVTFLAGLTEIAEPPQTPAREYAVAVAGPMVSLLLAGLGLAFAPLLPDGGIARLVVQVLAFTNGIVAVFNLLPGLPLDGGRVLRAGVWRLTGDAELSTRAAAWAGRGIALVVVPAVMLLVLPELTGAEPTVGTALVTALVAGFIYLGATASLQRARVLSRLPAATVGALARPALRVPADLPLGEAVRRAQEAGVHGLVVVDSADELTAVVSEAAVKATPEHRRPWVSVDSVARRLEPGLVLDPALGGEDLLAALRGSPASEYVVLGPAPGQVRVLASADVVKAAQG
jgi:Zn-dependent protease